LKRKKETTITHEESVRILLAMACWKALAISHPPKKFQKIHLHIGITAECPDPSNSTYGTPSPLGVKLVVLAQIASLSHMLFFTMHNILVSKVAVIA
jgi:hypothetical protein